MSLSPGGWFHRKQAHEFYVRNGFENRAYLFSKSLAQADVAKRQTDE